jgi:hypothetical protein
MKFTAWMQLPKASKHICLMEYENNQNHLLLAQEDFHAQSNSVSKTMVVEKYYFNDNPN